MRKATSVTAAMIAVVTMIGPAIADGEWDYRSAYEVAGTPRDCLGLKVKPEFRFQDMTEHYYTHLDVGAEWKATPYLVLAPYYRHVYQRSKGAWKTEYRPHLSATVKFGFAALRLSYRNRLEYRIRSGKDTFRYRGRIVVTLPRITGLGLTPFLGNEIFYDLDGGEITKNRAHGGLGTSLGKRLKVEVCYVLDSNKKQDAWPGLNALATALKYSF
jgi:hypothetical protein